jgi:hypothetical protein
VSRPLNNELQLILWETKRVGKSRTSAEPSLSTHRIWPGTGPPAVGGAAHRESLHMVLPIEENWQRGNDGTQATWIMQGRGIEETIGRGCVCGA